MIIVGESSGVAGAGTNNNQAGAGQGPPQFNQSQGGPAHPFRAVGPGGFGGPNMGGPPPPFMPPNMGGPNFGGPNMGNFGGPMGTYGVLCCQQFLHVCWVVIHCDHFDCFVQVTYCYSLYKRPTVILQLAGYV